METQAIIGVESTHNGAQRSHYKFMLPNCDSTSFGNS